MQYDLSLILDFCNELGLQCVRRSAGAIAIRIGDGSELIFQNDDKDDCLVGFEGTAWHTHGSPVIFASRTHSIEVDYLDIVSGLQDRTILICELWRNGALSDRWLVHRDFIDEFRHLEDGEEIRIRPATAGPKTVISKSGSI